VNVGLVQLVAVDWGGARSTVWGPPDVVEVEEDGGTELPVALDPEPVEPPVDDPVEPFDPPVDEPFDPPVEPPVEEPLDPPVEPEGGGNWYPADDEFALA
jgi:hypothetical protein